LDLVDKAILVYGSGGGAIHYDVFFYALIGAVLSKFPLMSRFGLLNNRLAFQRS